jgi:chorismate synthase
MAFGRGVKAQGGGLTSGPNLQYRAVVKLIQTISNQFKSVQTSFDPNRTFPELEKFGIKYGFGF